MNDNIVVCREFRRFIRDPKSHKSQLKMTRDKKSHKKALKEKVSKVISKKQFVKEVPDEYSVSEPKPVKPALHQPKKLMGKVRSNENLLACLEDIECAEEDAKLDRLDVNRGKKYHCIEDNHLLTFSEYEIQCEQDNKLWAYYKKQGLTRKMFEDAREYEKNVKALEDEHDPENREELLFKIWKYEENFDKWVEDERIKMENWFNNFEENNPDFVQKIRERNYCLAETVYQAIMG